MSACCIDLLLLPPPSYVLASAFRAFALDFYIPLHELPLLLSKAFWQHTSRGNAPSSLQRTLPHITSQHSRPLRNICYRGTPIQSSKKISKPSCFLFHLPL